MMNLFIKVQIIVMFFISLVDPFWRHPFTAENPLVSKPCNAKFKIYSDEETNSSNFWWLYVNMNGRC